MLQMLRSSRRHVVDFRGASRSRPQPTYHGHLSRPASWLTPRLSPHLTTAWPWQSHLVQTSPTPAQVTRRGSNLVCPNPKPA